jgi:hypothetical protein
VFRFFEVSRSPLKTRLSLPLFVLVLAPFVLVPIGARLLVMRIGDAMARKLERFASLVPVGAGAPGGAPCVPDRITANHPDPPPVEGARSVPVTRGRAALRRRAPSTEALVISEARLRRLTASQLRGVGWATVERPEETPAGVRLSGVGALGLGLADGDLVTSINGRPTPSYDDATAAGAAAWASGARAAHATIVRRGETIAVTVEIPANPANDATRESISASTKEEPGVK